MHKHLFFVLFLMGNLHSSAQVNYPQNYFDSPLHIPITLAGNFGEIRPNHFHAGFDLRTGNKEGLAVYAVADGYVSRIKISPIGYGKALYITHPNGFVSVYGHLRSFNESIQAKTMALQNQLQSFEIDTLLNPGLLPVKKGDLIGFSGNTGSSQAPHLHFEIRNEITEMPVNPYLFGYKVEDTVKPIIESIAVYALGADSRVNGKRTPGKKIKTHLVNGNYMISEADSLMVNGEIGFAINCYDKETGSPGSNNVYSIEMQSGGKRVFYYEMNQFSFDNARYVNAHIDYSKKEMYHELFQKCFLAKNNSLEIYKDIQNRGIITINDKADHWITFIVKDFVGNTSTLTLKVKGGNLDREMRDYREPDKMNCLEENQYKQKGIHVSIPAAAMYDDLFFRFSQSNRKGTLSPVYQINDEKTALQKNITLAIDAANVPKQWSDKACIAYLEGKFVKNKHKEIEYVSGKFKYEGGEFINDSIVTTINHFGKFTITLDTLPPKITPLLKLSKTDSIQDFRFLKALKFKATDNFSGVQHYRATIDERWVICEYDAKNDLLFYTFDDILQPGIHKFKLEVADDKGNKKEWKTLFKR